MISDVVTILFCDACVSRENPLLIGMGMVAIKAQICETKIRPLYVDFIFKENRTLSSVSETPFYELFSVAEGLAYLARLKAKDDKAIVCSDCSGTIDLLTRVARAGAKVSFKHKSLYLASLGADYNQHTGFYWLRRNNKGMMFADLLSKTETSSILDMSTIAKYVVQAEKELLNTDFPLEMLKCLHLDDKISKSV